VHGQNNRSKGLAFTSFIIHNMQVDVHANGQLPDCHIASVMSSSHIQATKECQMCNPPPPFLPLKPGCFQLDISGDGGCTEIQMQWMEAVATTKPNSTKYNFQDLQNRRRKRRIMGGFGENLPLIVHFSTPGDKRQAIRAPYFAIN